MHTELMNNMIAAQTEVTIEGTGRDAVARFTARIADEYIEFKVYQTVKILHDRSGEVLTPYSAALALIKNLNEWGTEGAALTVREVYGLRVTLKPAEGLY